MWDKEETEKYEMYVNDSNIGIEDDTEDKSMDELLDWILLLQFSLTSETKEDVLSVIVS